ncbi:MULTISPECIES: BglG family transcription antiterminator [Clostridium]|uniref:BglG family transcription antiterminator n=1 Tax=Clostridium frigoriphilum TaxID=443253 RepID=A0ABU7UW81_9CLOT|nr:BglG family transcription antiterminator [Clostridium sp. DSM 17811]MBU3101985.1 BglG family transcription antiterminator [Clostridium sp. DSM 17811]
MNLSVLDERKRRILAIVYHSKAPLQMEHIAARIGVSSRTIYSDIKDINGYFKSTGIEIVSKPRIGTWLEVKDGEEEKVKLEISKIINESSDEACEKLNYILKRLLMTNDYISMQEIADELYVSKATVNLEMRDVEETLKKSKIKFIRKTNHGIKVSGEEKNIRLLLTKILKNDKDVSIFLTNTDDGELQMDLKLSHFINNNFNNILINYLKKFISKILSEKKVRLSNERLTELVGQLLVTYFRINKKQNIQFSTDEILQIIKLSEFKMVKSFLEDFEKESGIKISIEEVSYITLFCIEDVVNVEELNKLEKDIFLNNDEELMVILNEICEFAKNSYNLKLGEDKQLMKGLKLHLAAAINRLKFGIDLNNPLIKEIKNNYPYAFQIAVGIENHINDLFGIAMTENEIGYVTLHIEAFIEKNVVEKDIKAFVVCGTGIGVAHLLSVQIKRQFPRIDVIKLISGLWISKEMTLLSDKETPDIVITSISLPTIKIPVVQVAPIMTLEDISTIQYQLDSLIRKKKEIQNKNYPMLKKYLDRESLLINISTDNHFDIITLLSKNLESKGYVTKKFAKSAISREELSCTYLSSGVAIPHGYIQEVNEPVITFAKLREPINWGGNKVQLVFLCALNSKVGKDAETLFTELYEIVKNKELVKKIKQIDSKDDLYNCLGWE